MEKNFQFNGQTVKISVFSDNIVRVRVGKNFEPTLFERYNIWNNPDNAGKETEKGVTAGDLTVSFDDGVLTFRTEKVVRTIDFHQDNLNEVHEYFNTTLNNLRPKREHIIGDIYEWETKLQKFDFQCRRNAEIQRFVQVACARGDPDGDIDQPAHGDHRQGNRADGSRII